MDQVSALVVEDDSRMFYSSRKVNRLITLSSIPCLKNTKDQLLTGNTSSVFQRLVLNYGPHLFIGIFDNIAHEKKRYDWESAEGIIQTNPYVTRHPMDLWFIVVYWFWRIAHNPDMPIVAARQLPREIINKIVLYILHNTDGYNRNRMTVSVGWNSKEWNQFCTRLIKKK